MAPARMMQFVDKHVRECAVCREDADLHDEVEKIREFVLPESKIPKAIREVSAEISPEEDEEEQEEQGEDYRDESEEVEQEEYIDDDEFDEEGDDELADEE